MISYSNQHIAGIFCLKAWDAVTNLMSDISVILEEKSYDYEWASSPSHCNEDYIYIISWKQKVQLALSQAILVRIHYTYWDKHRNFVFPSFLYFFSDMKIQTFSCLDLPKLQLILYRPWIFFPLLKISYCQEIGNTKVRYLVFSPCLKILVLIGKRFWLQCLLHHISFVD